MCFLSISSQEEHESPVRFKCEFCPDLTQHLRAGMGPEMLCESFLPTFISMKDARTDLKSDSWFKFYGDGMLKSGDFYLNSMEKYTDSPKEVLKQKMLNHEAIFRKQVYELHRLYRIQKNLMEDLNWNGSNKYAAQTAIPQLGTFPFQMTSDCVRSGEKISLIPWLYEIEKASQLRKFDSGTYRLQTHVMSPRQNGKLISRTQVENKVAVKDCEGIDSKRLKLQQKTLDLQLTADEYIDSITTELVVDGNLQTSVSESLETNNFLTSSIVVDPEKVKLTLSIGEDKIREGESRGSISNGCTSSYNRSIIDLEESLQGICREEATTSSMFGLAASPFVGEKHGSQLPTHSDPTFLVRTRKDSQHLSTWNHSLAEHGGSCQELKSANLDAGLRESRGNPFIDVFNEKQQPPSYASLHVGLNRIQDVQLEGSSFTSHDQITIFPSPTIFQVHPDELPCHRSLNRGLQPGLCDSQSFSSTTLDKLRLFEHVPKDQGLAKISNVSVSRDTVTEESVHLTLGLSNGFLHSDIRGDAIAIDSTVKIGSLYASLGSVDLPQSAGDAEARQVCTEKSEEDTLSSSLIKNCVVVQAAAYQAVEEKVAGNCRDLPTLVGNEPNSTDENKSDNIIDLESTADEPKQEQSILFALEPSGTTCLEPRVNENHNEQIPIAETDVFSCLQKESNKSESELQSFKEQQQEQALETVSIDSVIRTAAESLLLISSEKSKKMLDWFADAVSLNARSVESLCEEKYVKEQPQTSDSYETIALMLTETSMSEYSVSVKPSDKKETEGIPCGLSLRRGRRIRDFQREILPGLISLSRYEVSEDINSIRGMIKATELKKNRSRQTCREVRFLPTRNRRSRCIFTGQRS